MLMHSNAFKKISLFTKVNSHPFFLFGFYMGTQPTQVFKNYKVALEPLGLKLERYRDSFFFKDNLQIYPILRGEFFFFFPKKSSLTLDTFSVDKTLTLLEDSTLFSQYFFPYCLGTSNYLISFDRYKFFRMIARLSFLKLKAFPKNLFIFPYLFLSFFFKINLFILRFTYGYFKSINTI